MTVLSLFILNNAGFETTGTRTLVQPSQDSMAQYEVSVAKSRTAGIHVFGEDRTSLPCIRGKYM